MTNKQPITKKLNVPADVVWKAIREIGRLDVWFPIIESCRVEGEGQGALRYMYSQWRWRDKRHHRRNRRFSDALGLSTPSITLSCDQLQRHSRSV